MLFVDYWRESILTSFCALESKYLVKYYLMFKYSDHVSPNIVKKM